MQLVEAAEALDEPGPLRRAWPHDRRAAVPRQRVSGIGDVFSPTSRTRNATQAGDLLAAQARRLIASDVVWDDQFKDPSRVELRRQGIQG